jgi:hypothetical protein
MVAGLLVIALSDVGSIMTSADSAFLGYRALAGVGWAMFGTVVTTIRRHNPLGVQQACPRDRWDSDVANSWAGSLRARGHTQ